MRFILDLTRRELRSSWRRLLFFFLCIALGVGSVVALRSLVQNLKGAVGGDARALLTADIEISSTNDLSPTELQAIEAAAAQFPIVDARGEAVTAAVMARPVDPSKGKVKFVELKGIDGTFPLVGDFFLSDGTRFDPAILEKDGAVVARIILDDLNIKIGDKIRIGESDLTVKASFDEEPGGSSGFRLGGRVIVDKKTFEEAGIIRNNGRVRRRILLRTTADPTALTKALREALKGTGLNVTNYREQEENLSDQFERTENYLSLAGLLMLVLGGAGIWNVARAFVEQKRRSVAILKCLGAGGDRIVTVYLLQILLLGLLGSLLGVALAQAALLFVRAAYSDVMPAKMTYGVSPFTAIQGILLGVLISLIFSALPLLQIRSIKPSLLLRDANNENLSRFDRTRTIFAFLSISGLVGLAVWQAGSVSVGVIFIVGLTVTGLILYGASALLTAVLRRLRPSGNFSLSQSVNSLYRPGNQTRVILLAVGLGVFVVTGVRMMQNDLVKEFDISRNEKLPSMFFVDIRPGQIDEFEKILRTKAGEAAETIPTVRARISHVNGEPVNYQNREVRQRQGQIGREFTVTYRPELQSNESVIAGKWWPDDTTDPQVSVEKDIAETLNVKAGDSITFAVSGRPITARVANIRKIDIRNTRSAFLFVFRPGTLDEAPKSYAASVLKHLPSTERQHLQRELVDKFPNVQIFDIDDIMATVQRLVKNFVIAISFVGSFVMLTGILMLIGSVALTKSQRIYENAVLKTLGAKRRTLFFILIGEYGILGLIAGVIGAGFAVAMSFAVTRYVMNIEWTFDIVTMIAGISITTATVVMVGLAVSIDVLFRKPLATLRGQ